MATTITVPLNTMLADLDESLRALFKRELERHGFDGAEIAFDTPSKEWSGSLSVPTLSLFLYDLREAEQAVKGTMWQQVKENGETREVRPPLRVDASYAVTAWTRAVEDEHRLLSQVLAIMHAYTELPDDILVGTLKNGSQQFPLKTRAAQPNKDGKADFWTSIGGQYKASVDYVVTVACESGTSYERGPEVRSQTFRLLQTGRRATMQELHRTGGVVKDAEGAPVANAWVVLKELGRYAATDGEGHFKFDRIDPGTYTVGARAADGTEVVGKLTLPGAGVELVLGAPPAKTKRK